MVTRIRSSLRDPVERRSVILDLLRRSERLRIADLSRALGVSEVTIRKDVRLLAQDGYVRREWGCVLPVSCGQDVPSAVPYEVREETEEETKRALARCAAALARECRTVFVGMGTTMTLLARELAAYPHLLVITNSLPAAWELARGRGTVHLLGGRLRAASLAAIGHSAERGIQEFRADLAFLGVYGFDLAAGYTTPHPAEATIDRLMLEHAAQGVVVAHSAKFHRVAPAVIAPVQRVHILVTDDRICQDPDWRTLEGLAPRVVTVPGRAETP